MKLDTYTLLGRSGLRVSPIALGTMTFGTEWGWGADEGSARRLFDLYVDAGGNFIDTADLYTEGTSETWVGRFTAARGLREQLVIATKYSYNAQTGNPNAGGNHRKNLLRALEGSLKRLGTDYIDLYYLHTWDRMTPVDEVMRAMDDAVRAGKIRYVGLSDVPAWYAGRAQTLADWRGFEPVAAMQLEYSLIERNAEHEFADLATQLGMGLVPWSPLGMGVLSGKYRPSQSGADGASGLAAAASAGRLQTVGPKPPPGFDKLSPRNFAIVGELERVAHEAGRPMAQVALNWLYQKRGVSSIIVGATKAAQLEESLGALDFMLAPELIARLDAASEPAHPFPYYMFADGHQARIHGQVNVRAEPANHAHVQQVPAPEQP
ncbi:1-deoxyxylulose-5-phosphate synthase YajO [Paraburkholderia caffeinitolerans]|uniref:1-deoxyxylulose-5-phosphate synthase YajO n=1 Tax=Paraburkholderia caffeinitolerans TaxID=1723730 RepID=A0A6J5FXV8_9BURK|nr:MULTISPECIES: aldo/keto reductase [Paraburkholderia]CAB3786904.1 1-deoxyxylulose-5-phosphate synthase YajO [Paraburkholderia caffeinitolerans]